VVMQQMNLMKESKLNEAGSQIVSIRYGGFSGPTTNNHFLTFKDQLSRNPQIKNVTLANHLPRQDFFGPINMEFQFPEVSEQRLAWSQLNGDYDFLRTFDLKLLAGRDFDYQNTADSNAVILNRTAVAALKLSPEEALGKIYSRPDVRTYGDRDTTLSPITGIVVGVVEDFPYRSLYNKIDPLAISARPHFEDRIIHIRIAEGSFSNTISSIESTWKSLFPAYAFDYWFINDEFNRMYEREIQMTRITETFSVIAILITCVGLYGLATFMSEQKTKEIGIRKTLGSSNTQIVFLQLKIFGKIIALAVCIGLPISYAVSNWWLSNFAYQTNVSVEVFGLSVLVISLLTFLTVGYETLKASLVNPVKALKHD
jgi:putative ABC transport system permease protein